MVIVDNNYSPDRYLVGKKNLNLNRAKKKKSIYKIEPFPTTQLTGKFRNLNISDAFKIKITFVIQILL